MRAQRVNVTRSHEVTVRSGTHCDTQLMDGVFVTDVWLDGVWGDDINQHSPWLGEVWA